MDKGTSVSNREISKTRERTRFTLTLAYTSRSQRKEKGGTKKNAHANFRMKARRDMDSLMSVLEMHSLLSQWQLRPVTMATIHVHRPTKKPRRPTNIKEKHRDHAGCSKFTTTIVA